MTRFTPTLILVFAAAIQMLGGAAFAACDGKLNKAGFAQYLSMSGSDASILWPKGVFPLGHPMDIVVEDVPPQDEDYRYHVYARAAGAVGDPQVLPISSVSVNRERGVTTIRVKVELRDEDKPVLQTRASFLVLACSTDGADNEVKGFASMERTVSTWVLGVGVAGIAAFVGLLALCLGVKAFGLGPRAKEQLGAYGFKGLFLDHRDRMSLSLFQVMIFFASVFLAVAYVFGRTRELSDLSADVLMLLGISAGGAVAGRAGDVARNRLSWENWSWLKFELEAFPTGDDAPKPKWRQLVSNQGRFDMYRFQALLFTLLVAPAFVVMSLYSLGEASIPLGIVGVLGLSQVTYLVGKVAAEPTLADFDARTTKLREKYEEGEEISEKQWRKYKQEFAVAMEVPWSENAKARARDPKTNPDTHDTDHGKPASEMPAATGKDASQPDDQ